MVRGTSSRAESVARTSWSVNTLHEQTIITREGVATSFDLNRQ